MRFYQLDNDTKKYIKRLNYNGIKTPADIYSVDQFIRGLKDLGIYGNMIEAWFFRKNHNAGSGNIVYAFRDSFNNGTINNISTAVWNDRGLICTANATSSISNYVTCSLRPNLLETCSLFSIFMSTPAGMENFTNGYPYISNLGVNSYPNNSISIISAGSSGTSWGVESKSLFAGSILGNTLFKVVKGSFTSSTILAESRNSSSTLTSASTSNTNTPRTVFYDRIIFGGRWSSGSIQSNSGNFGVGFNGTHIFHCFFDIDVNFTIFESLFKSTIGKGIALP
jgi:hypothetical protein